MARGRGDRTKIRRTPDDHGEQEQADPDDGQYFPEFVRRDEIQDVSRRRKADPLDRRPGRGPPEPFVRPRQRPWYRRQTSRQNIRSILHYQRCRRRYGIGIEYLL